MKDIISVVLVAAALSLLAGFGGATLRADETEIVDTARASYIVKGTTIEAAIRAVNAVGGEITHELRIIDSVTATMTRAQRDQLSAEKGVVHISNNGTVETSETVVR